MDSWNRKLSVEGWDYWKVASKGMLFQTVGEAELKHINPMALSTNKITLNSWSYLTAELLRSNCHAQNKTWTSIVFLMRMHSNHKILKEYYSRK